MKRKSEDKKARGEITKDETNTLLYLETCLVDHRGFIQPIKMNKDDWIHMEKWKAEGLMDYGRRNHEEIMKSGIVRGGARTHWIRFSDILYNLAHQKRQERAERNTITLDVK